MKSKIVMVVIVEVVDAARAGSTKPTPSFGRSCAVSVVSSFHSHVFRPTRRSTVRKCSGSSLPSLIVSEPNGVARHSPLAWRSQRGSPATAADRPTRSRRGPWTSKQAGVDAGGRRPGPHGRQRSAALRAERLGQERRRCVCVVAGVASGDEQAHGGGDRGKPQEREQRSSPGVRRALRRPQFFVGRHVEFDPLFLRARERGVRAHRVHRPGDRPAFEEERRFCRPAKARLKITRLGAGLDPRRATWGGAAWLCASCRTGGVGVTDAGEGRVARSSRRPSGRCAPARGGERQETTKAEVEVLSP